MAVVSMADITHFFEGETKQLKRGKNSYSSNRLENFYFPWLNWPHDGEGPCKHEG